MKKISLFLLVIVFLFSSSMSLAARHVDLSAHGKELMKAPFPVRHAFYKKYRKDWMRSSYNQRKEFLTQWHQQQIQQAKQAQADAKAERYRQRDKSRAIRNKQRDEASKARAARNEARAEASASKNRSKAFNQRIKANQRFIQNSR